MTGSADPERLRDCAADWLQLPPVEIARAMHATRHKVRRLGGIVYTVSELGLNGLKRVHSHAARYERGRYVLLSRLVSP